MKITSIIFMIIILSLVTFTVPSFATVKITGAGATLPAPIYSVWADIYQKSTGIKVNYQSIGSSGGIKQIIANTIDFGASDVPLSNEELNKNNLFQFPTVISGIVLVVNIQNIKNNELILNGKIINDIYIGKIKKWNDPEITRLNPNVNLPNKTIIVIHRSDGSGTSFVFTKYLSSINSEWKKKIGFGSIINWPVGLGGKGNDGVSAFVQRLSGTIGYIEYSYAKQNNLTCVKLITENGNTILPTKKSFIEAIKNIKWNRSFNQDIVNQPGKNSWPIISTTFILLHKNQNSIEKGKEILNFFNWAYNYSKQQSNNLDYITLPNKIINYIRLSWKIELKSKDGKIIWK